MRRQGIIRHFATINELHEATGFVGRTDLPAFHIFTLEETYPSTRVMMPPYSLRFYSVGLYGESGDARIEFNAERHEPSDTIAFQGPGHVVSWVRGAAQRGFMLHFQPEFLSHTQRALIESFPFFHPTALNVLPLASADRGPLQAAFTQLHATFAGSHPYRPQLLQAQLLILLYEARRLYDDAHARLARQPAASALTVRFLQLIDQHALTRLSVESCADLLGVTPNYLSRVISSSLGRRARDLIDERVLMEARKLLHYTDLSVGEIAAQLGFAEATHFTRFFRRKAGNTPASYRSQVTRHLTAAGV